MCKTEARLCVAAYLFPSFLEALFVRNVECDISTFLDRTKFFRIRVAYAFYYLLHERP